MEKKRYEALEMDVIEFSIADCAGRFGPSGPIHGAGPDEPPHPLDPDP